MKIGFFPRYDRLGASSRYRFFMYYDLWRKLYKNDSVFIKPGLSDDYLRSLYRQGRVSKCRKMYEFARMIMRGMSLPEKLLLEYELVPFLPWKYEKKLLDKRSYILNFDDNVWEKYRDDPKLADKYDNLCRNASGVIVANEFLWNKVKLLNSNLLLLPTVLDLELYQDSPVEKFETFTVVWIGTPVTYIYLEKHLSVLQKLFPDKRRELLVIADAKLAESRPLKGVNVRYVDWSAENEVELLRKSHVGIMPLIDDEFSRGKSAFKLLQYQAAGLPLIASGVGENCNVVKHSGNGFIANSADEWLEALDRLQNDSVIYEKFSCECKSLAYEYSIQKYFPLFYNFIHDKFAIK